MAQESGPLVGANFTDVQWRAIFGGEPGIVGDVDGSAYNLTLGAGTDDAQLGSTTQDSVAVVGGFMHRIPAGQTQAVTIPPSTNAVGRTDIIAVRLDAGTYTSAPGPCRLVRIAGVEGSSARPSMDEAPPGVEDFPLWAVTRKGNGTTAEGLNQAAKVDLRRRTGPNLYIARPDVALPTHVPLGTRATRAGLVYRRQMNGTGPSAQPEWFNETEAAVPWDRMAEPTYMSGNGGTAAVGWYGGSEPTLNNARFVRGRDLELYLRLRLSSGTVPVDANGSFTGTPTIFTLDPAWRPLYMYPFAFTYRTTTGGVRSGIGRVSPAGDVQLVSGVAGSPIDSFTAAQGYSFMAQLRHTIP